MPNPASSPTADVEQVFLPKYGDLVTVNSADVPYLREKHGALSAAEYAAKRAAEAAAEGAAPKGGKPFKSKAEKASEAATGGDTANDGDPTVTTP